MFSALPSHGVTFSMWWSEAPGSQALIPAGQSTVVATTSVTSLASASWTAERWCKWPRNGITCQSSMSVSLTTTTHSKLTRAWMRNWTSCAGCEWFLTCWTPLFSRVDIRAIFVSVQQWQPTVSWHGLNCKMVPCANGAGVEKCA